PWLQAFTTLGATGISLMLLLVGVGGIIGNYVSGLTTDRFGARATQLVLIILLAVDMALLPLIADSLIIGSILIFVWGFVGQGFIAPQLVRIVGVNQALSTAALGLNSSFINVGLAIGAAAGGLFIDQIGVQSLTWLGVGGTILSLGVFGLSWMMENRQRALEAVS
ncbi:MAG: MFS transporter, partial [Chloroflexota bacterium]